MAKAKCKRGHVPKAPVAAGARPRTIERKKRSLDEPQPEGDDWVEFGGEMIWAMGFTEGGCPYGLSLEDFRRMNENARPRADWALAKHVLTEALRIKYGNAREDTVGWVRFLGEGLSYRAYYAECRIPGRDGGTRTEQTLVARLPRRDAPENTAEQARREVRLLEHLATLELPVRIPKVIACVPVANGLAVVQILVEGSPLETRAPRNPRVRPWEAVAEAAASCHGLETTPIAGFVPSHPTRRAHALAHLDVLDRLDIPEAHEARAWAQDHLPSEEPARLVHGDLLGQNILLDLDGGALGLIDWSAAVIGDPAYDLAVVTRGTRQPFQVADGFEKFLAAYHARVEDRITAEQVRLHELCLLAGFYAADAREFGSDSPHAENTRRRLGGFLRRTVSDR